MKAVILVGGFGTRLRPLTYTTPKQMLPVVEVPMLERKIRQLVANGVDDIILSMGYKPDGFKAAYPDNTCAGAKLTYVIEPEPLDTAGAVAYAAREAGVDSTFFAMNGDILADMDIKGLLELHKSSGAEATLALTPVEDPSRFGVVPTEADGKVIAFIEKPKREEAPTNLINAGTYILEPAFIERVEAGRKVSIEREIFPKVASEGKIYAGHFDRYWIDIGTPEAYVQGNTDILDQENGGEPFVGEGAEVAADADVRRSVIGKGAKVGSGAVLIDAVLLPGAVIEAGATVERSVVGARAVVGANASLKNLTVVGDGLNVDAGAQLDGEKVNPPNVD